MPGTLYVVSTPIGNLDDITYRAVKILKEVDFILCEDTRETRKLLNHFYIQVNTLSYHQQSTDSKRREILGLLLDGKNLALVCDAGTPGISDPGNELVDYISHHSHLSSSLLRTRKGWPVAAAAGMLHDADVQIRIVPIPGSSSITAAISVCGFNMNNFLFIGFWPKKRTKRVIEKMEEVDCPVIFFESPYRILKTLTFLESRFPERRMFIGQELTKMHERTLCGRITDVKTEMMRESKKLGRIKGEIVCILE